MPLNIVEQNAHRDDARREKWMAAPPRGVNRSESEPERHQKQERLREGAVMRARATDVALQLSQPQDVTIHISVPARDGPASAAIELVAPSSRIVTAVRQEAFEHRSLSDVQLVSDPRDDRP
jgi:hypothetical protein